MYQGKVSHCSDPLEGEDGAAEEEGEVLPFAHSGEGRGVFEVSGAVVEDDGDPGHLRNARHHRQVRNELDQIGQNIDLTFTL